MALINNGMNFQDLLREQSVDGMKQGIEELEVSKEDMELLLSTVMKENAEDATFSNSNGYSDVNNTEIGYDTYNKIDSGLQAEKRAEHIKNHMFENESTLNAVEANKTSELNQDTSSRKSVLDLLIQKPEPTLSYDNG